VRTEFPEASSHGQHDPESLDGHDHTVLIMLALSLRLSRRIGQPVSQIAPVTFDAEAQPHGSVVYVQVPLRVTDRYLHGRRMDDDIHERADVFGSKCSPK
jgi:hypothetical protein